MPVPTARTDLSTTAASNSPAGSEAIGTNADDYLRTIQKFIKENYDDIQLRATIADPTCTGTLTQTGDALGTTAGDQTIVGTFAYSSANADKLNVFGYRRSNGATWTTVETRIQKYVDATPQGFITFGDGGRSTAAGGDGLILGGGNRETVFINDAGTVTIAEPTSGYSVDSEGAIRCLDNITAVDFIETSTRELKSEIVDVEAGAIDRIKSLGVKEYKFDGSDRKRVGVIAEEVDPRYSVDGTAVSLTAIIFDLVQAVKELEQRLAAK
jgi:hypothetical protein